MRSAVVAMLMAGAMAVPSAHRAHMRVHEAREAHPEEVVVTATAYTTVMAGAAPTVAPVAQEKVVTVSAPAANSIPAAPSAYTPPAPVQASGSAPSAPAPSSSANTGNLDDYAKKAVDTHNQHRANHSAPALSYDSGLAAAAMTLASKCSWPNGGSPHDVSIDQASLGPYGQNAACGAAGADIADTITGEWYNNEVMSYTFFGSEPPQSVFTLTGHFTQIVWKGTTKVGCATASCPNGVGNSAFPSVKSMTICNYGGPGNYAGQYATNVLPALGHANMAASSMNVQNV